MRHVVTIFVLAALQAACSGGAGTPPAQGAAQPAQAAATATAGAPQAAADGDDAPPAYEAALPVELRVLLQQTYTGDFDGMVKRRVIRAGVPFNRTYYFIDEGQQRGLAYEYLMLFEEALNKKLNTGLLKVHVVPMPLPRDQLLSALQAGKVDLVAAQLTITPERQAIVDFTAPSRRGVNEIVVTGPESPAINSVDELAGKRVHVRKTSSYYQSLQALNQRFAKEGKTPVDINEASDYLEDDDLLEMVNAGLIDAVVVDDYLAKFWGKIFPKLQLHENVQLRSGADIAGAVRKKSPKFLAEINAFVAANGFDSAIGRILNNRYLSNTKYVTNARSEASRRKFEQMAAIFKKYGDQYDFDYLMMAAQGYQESRLDHNARSHVGAIGVMQVMPATGAEQKVGDIKQLEPNIHAGVKYMRFMRDQYFKDEPMSDLNKALFTFASYNAGPGRIRGLRREAAKRGLDPNVWFGNVEHIASERIGRETVTYVANIYKYYLAYSLVVQENARRKAAKTAITSGGSR